MRFIYKKISAALAAVAVSGMVGVTALAAPVYNDVPSTHWAYPYISAVADRGLMIGDTFANFRPDDLLDKFETSKILARSAGYKYENISAAEQDYYNGCYEKNKSFLSQYSARFTKWNTSADREIAFLLEKEILTVADLNQFVIFDDGGKEQLRALSRGEASVFITKLVGKTAQAMSHTPSSLMTDDVRIPATVKPYVYYLQSINVISGDADGNFNANGAVTRAAMATMLARALDLITAGSPAAPPTPGAGVAISSISSVTGVIDAYYSNLNAVQILTASGEKKIYRLSARGSVYVDGYLKVGADLSEGMTVNGLLENEELIELRAQSVTRPSEVDPPPTNANANVQYSELDGTVASTDEEGAVRTVNIEVKTVNPRDNTIMTDTRAYALASGCKITRAGEAIRFSDIERGDIITAQVSGGMAYELAIEERVMKLNNARLDEKRYDQKTGQASYVITDAKGKTYELRISSDTRISRRGSGSSEWDELRVGDTLDLTAEYGVIDEIMASGERSTAEGWIESVYIGSFQSYITLRDSYGDIKQYYVIPDETDVYSLRVGDRMRVRLDSEEIITVVMLEESGSGIVTGYVDTIRSDSIVLVNTQSYGSNSKRTVEIDDTTVFTNTRTGDHVNFNAIRTGQRVYVVFYSSGSGIAKTVTILSD